MGGQFGAAGKGLLALCALEAPVTLAEEQMFSNMSHS